MSIKKGNRRRFPKSNLFRSIEQSFLELKAYNKGTGTLFKVEFDDDGVTWIEHYKDGREVSRTFDKFHSKE